MAMVLLSAFEPVSQFYFTDDLNSFFPDLFYQFVFFADSRDSLPLHQH
jgi:hypothetical protein